MIKTIFRSFVLGIGVGILLAPRAGSETRRLLSEKLNNVIDGASELAEKLDHSAAEGGASAAFVPKQHYAESSSTREVGSADAMTL
jgi:gas vesicle protein